MSFEVLINKQWNTVNPVQQTDPLTYQGYAGAMASFIQTGDPNAHKVTNATVAGVPGIEEDSQFLVTPGGQRRGRIALLEERCTFLAGVAERVPI